MHSMQHAQHAIHLWHAQVTMLAVLLPRCEQAAEEDAAAADDEDVAAERERVKSGGASSDSLCLCSLRKVYEGDPPKVPHMPCFCATPGACGLAHSRWASQWLWRC